MEKKVEVCITSSTMAITMGQAIAAPSTINRAYKDAQNKVRIVNRAGKQVAFFPGTRARDLCLSHDRTTQAWIVRVFGNDQLTLYRNHKTHIIQCAGVISNFRFVNQGRQACIDCGGAHFAGEEILYDTATHAKLASVDQGTVILGQRPPWSQNSDYSSTHHAFVATEEPKQCTTNPFPSSASTPRPTTAAPSSPPRPAPSSWAVKPPSRAT